MIIGICAHLGRIPKPFRITAEFGLIAPNGVWRIPELHQLAQDSESVLSFQKQPVVRKLIMMQIEDLQSNVKALERTIRARHRANELSQRLAIIPAVGGGITGTAIVATVVDASAFKSGRQQPGSLFFPSRSADCH